MPDRQKIFNQLLSKVRLQLLSSTCINIQPICVRSEHFYGSLKGWFQSLQEMRFQIQNQQDLNFANMWMCCCLILHNLILEIKEDLGLASSNMEFMEEVQMWGAPLVHEQDDEGEDFIGSESQMFHVQLVEQLFSRAGNVAS